MATSTRPESHTFDDRPDDGTSLAAPEATPISAADQAALAGFAAAWTRSSTDNDADDDGADLFTSGNDTPHRAATVHASEYTAQPGIPGRGIIVLSLAATSVCAALDFTLTGGLSMFFDLCFIVICLVGAMAVRRKDLFTTGVMSPLVFAAVIGAIAVIAPHAFSDVGGFAKVFPTGLAQHAAALVSGYGIALLTVGGRVGANKR